MDKDKGKGSNTYGWNIKSVERLSTYIFVLMSSEKIRALNSDVIPIYGK